MTLLLDWWQLGWAATGFFAVMTLALAYALTHKKERRWYRTVVPSEYIIEREA